MTIAFYSAAVRVLASLEIGVEPGRRKCIGNCPFAATPA